MLLYRIDGKWRLYDEMYASERIAVEDVAEPTPPFDNSPTGVVAQYAVGAVNGDADAVDEALYSESPRRPIEDGDVVAADEIVVAEVEQRSIDAAAEAASFADPDDLETAALLAQDRHGVGYEFVVLSYADEESVTRTPVLVVEDSGEWFFHTDQFS